MITTQKLIEWHACSEAIDAFVARWPSGRASAKAVLHALQEAGELRWLVWLTRSPACEEMLDAGADPNQTSPYGWTPLLLAAWRGNEATIRHLLAQGANPNQTSNKANVRKGWTPLLEAIDQGHESIAQLLREAGAK